MPRYNLKIFILFYFLRNWVAKWWRRLSAVITVCSQIEQCSFDVPLHADEATRCSTPGYSPWLFPQGPPAGHQARHWPLPVGTGRLRSTFPLSEVAHNRSIRTLLIPGRGDVPHSQVRDGNTDEAGSGSKMETSLERCRARRERVMAGSNDKVFRGGMALGEARDKPFRAREQLHQTRTASLVCAILPFYSETKPNGQKKNLPCKFLSTDLWIELFN